MDEHRVSGGNFQTLAGAGLNVTPVAVFTQKSETLGGRVKMLHPQIYVSLLADCRNATHLAQCEERGSVAVSTATMPSRTMAWSPTTNTRIMQVSPSPRAVDS